MPRTVFTPLQETNDVNQISSWLQQNRAARDRFLRISQVPIARDATDAEIIANAGRMVAEYDRIAAEAANYAARSDQNKRQIVDQLVARAGNIDNPDQFRADLMSQPLSKLYGLARPSELTMAGEDPNYPTAGRRIVRFLVDMTKPTDEPRDLTPEATGTGFGAALTRIGARVQKAVVDTIIGIPVTIDTILTAGTGQPPMKIFTDMQDEWNRTIGQDQVKALGLENVLATTAEMLPIMAAAYLTGGMAYTNAMLTGVGAKAAAQTAAGAFARAGLPMYFSRAVPDRYAQMAEDNKITYAEGLNVMLSAATEALTETLGDYVFGSKVFKWVGTMGKASAAKMVGKELSRKVLEFAGDMGMSVASEGMEEFVNTIANHYIDNVTLGKPVDLANMFSEAVESFTLGGLSAVPLAILGGGAGVYQGYRMQRIGDKVRAWNKELAALPENAPMKPLKLRLSGEIMAAAKVAEQGNYGQAKQMLKQTLTKVNNLHNAELAMIRLAKQNRGKTISPDSNLAKLGLYTAYLMDTVNMFESKNQVAQPSVQPPVAPAETKPVEPYKPKADQAPGQAAPVKTDITERAKAAITAKDITVEELTVLSEEIAQTINADPKSKASQRLGFMQVAINKKIAELTPKKTEQPIEPVVEKPVNKDEKPKPDKKVTPVKPINAGQQKLIHKLKADKRLSDEAYRAMLRESSQGRAESSAGLNTSEAATVIDKLKAIKSEKPKPETKVEEKPKRKQQTADLVTPAEDSNAEGVEADASVAKEKPDAKPVTPKPAWIMSLPDYVQQYINMSPYKKAYEKIGKTEILIKQARAKWVDDLKTQAIKGRISDDAIESYISEFGMGSLQSTFRGVYAKGIEGWRPADMISPPLTQKEKWQREMRELSAKLSEKDSNISPEEQRKIRARYKVVAESLRKLEPQSPKPEAKPDTEPEPQKTKAAPAPDQFADTSKMIVKPEAQIEAPKPEAKAKEDVVKPEKVKDQYAITEAELREAQDEEFRLTSEYNRLFRNTHQDQMATDEVQEKLRIAEEKMLKAKEELKRVKEKLDIDRRKLRVQPSLTTVPTIKGEAKPLLSRAKAKLIKIGFLASTDKKDATAFNKMRKVDISGLAEDIGRALPYLSADNDRPILTGVNISYDFGAVRIIATDGRRVYMRTYKANYGQEPFNLTITGKDATAISELNGQKIVLGIGSEGKSIAYRVNDAIYMSEPLANLYPEAEKAFQNPSESFKRHEVNRAALIEAISRLRDISNIENNSMYFRIDEDGKMAIGSVNRRTGAKYESRIEVKSSEVKGEDVYGNVALLMPLRGEDKGSKSITVNYKFLLDIINQTKGDTVSFLNWGDEISANDPINFDNNSLLKSSKISDSVEENLDPEPQYDMTPITEIMKMEGGKVLSLSLLHSDIYSTLRGILATQLEAKNSNAKNIIAAFSARYQTEFGITWKSYDEMLAHIDEWLSGKRVKASPNQSRTKLSDTLSKSLSSEQVDTTLKLYDMMFQTYANEMGVSLDEAYEYLSDVVTTMPEGEAMPQPNAAEIAEAERQMEEVRSKYEGTDQWLKAPNGKPTKLTERQWLQVRTPNFKKWFGDWENDPKNASKVVDENGEPMVVYHGTSTTDELTFFDPDLLGTNTHARSAEKGFFFSDNRDLTVSYASSKKDISSKIITIEKRLIPILEKSGFQLYADNLKNNKTMRGNSEIFTGYAGEIDWTNDMIDELSTHKSYSQIITQQDIALLGAVRREINRYSDRDIMNVVEVFLNLRSPMLSDHEGKAAWDSDSNGMTQDDLLDKALELNMDGLILKNSQDGMDTTRNGTTYVAFSPTQIKSATANVGTFDAENPDIRYQSIRGFVQFKDGKVTLGLVDPDFSTGLHEQAHIGLRLISAMAQNDKSGRWKPLLEKAEAWAGVKDGNWDVKAEEKFAQGYEKYLLTGKAPNPQTATIFSKIKQWMSAIVGKAKELVGIKLDDNIVSVYDAMLGVERVNAKAIKLNANKSVKTPRNITPTGYSYGKEINIANTQYNAGISTPAEYMKWWHKQLGGKGDKVLFEKYGKIGDIRAVTLGLDKYIDTIRMEYSDNFKKQQDAWVGDSPARRMWVENRLGYSEEQNQKIDELIHTVEEYYVKELADKEILSISGIMVGDENIGVLSKNVYGAKHLLVNAIQGGYAVSYEKDGVRSERMPGAKIVGTRLDYPAGYPTVDELIDDIIMQEYIKKNSKPIKSVIDEGVVSGSQRIAVYPNAREFFSDSTPKPANTAHKSNLNKEQKAESIKIKSNMKLKSQSRLASMEKELDTLLDKFGNLALSRPNSKRAVINNIDLNRNIIEIAETEDGLVINGKAFPTTYDAMQEITRLLSGNGITNSVTLAQRKKVNFSEDTLFQKNIDKVRKISEADQEKINSAYNHVLFTISGSVDINEWRNSLLDLIDTTIMAQHHVRKLDPKKFSELDSAAILKAIEDNDKYDQFVKDATGYDSIEDVSTYQAFELLSKMHPDFYSKMTDNAFIKNLIDATQTMSSKLGIDQNEIMTELFNLTVVPYSDNNVIGVVVKPWLRPVEILAKSFGTAGTKLASELFKGKIMYGRIQNYAGSFLKEVDKLLNSASNNAHRIYNNTEKLFIARTIFGIGSTEPSVIPDHDAAIREKVERYNQVAIDKISVDDVIGIYNNLRTMLDYIKAEGLALNERTKKDVFFAREEYIPRVFVRASLTQQPEVESKEKIDISEAANLKQRERTIPDASKLNNDLINSMRSYVSQVARYLSYYETKDYYENQFRKDTPANLRSRSAYMERYAVSYVNAAIGQYERKSDTDKVYSQLRLNLYASVLVSNLTLTLQNFNQRYLARVYAAPKVFRQVEKDAAWFSGKATKKVTSPKLVQMIEMLRGMEENQMLETYRESIEATREGNKFSKATVAVSGRALKYSPFSQAEKGNWTYGYLTGLYNAVMASNQYRNARKEGKTHYQATEIALSNQKVRDAALISAGEINAAINADPSMVFSPAAFSNNISKAFFFLKFFVNYLNLANNVVFFKGISNNWSRELFNYQLSGTDEQKMYANRIESLNKMIEDLRPSRIDKELSQYSSRLQSSNMTKADFARMYVELKTLRDMQVKAARDMSTSFATGRALRGRMIAGMAAYVAGDWLILVLMQLLRRWFYTEATESIHDRKLRKRLASKYEVDLAASALSATQIPRLFQGMGLFNGMLPEIDFRSTKGAAKGLAAWSTNLTPLLGLMNSMTKEVYGARASDIILDDLFDDK